MTLPVHYLQARQAAAVGLDHVALHLLHALPQRLVQLPQPCRPTSHVNWHTVKQRIQQAARVFAHPFQTARVALQLARQPDVLAAAAGVGVRKQVVLR